MLKGPKMHFQSREKSSPLSNTPKIVVAKGRSYQEPRPLEVAKVVIYKVINEAAQVHPYTFFSSRHKPH